MSVTGSAFTHTGGCAPGTYVGPIECEFNFDFTPTATGSYSGVLLVSYAIYGVPNTYQLNLTAYGLERPTKNPTPPVCGSIIKPSELSVVEEIPLVGVPFTLQYNSHLAPEFVSSQGTLDPSFEYNPQAWVPSVYKFYDYMNTRLFSGSSVDSVNYQISDSYDSATVVSGDGTEMYVFGEYGQHLSTISYLTGAIKYEFGYDVNGYLESITDAYGNETTITRDVNGYISKITSPYGQETDINVDGNGHFLTVTNPNNEVYTLTYKTGTGLLETFKKPGGQTTTLTYDSNGKLIKDLGHGGNFSEFSIGTSGNITHSSQMGREATYTSSYSSLGTSTQEVTESNLLLTIYSENGDQSTATTNAVESNLVTKIDDERLGSLYMRPSAKSYTIGGVTSSSSFAQTYLPGSGTGLFDYDSLVNTITVSSRVSTSSFNNTTKKMTMTSPEGVVSTIQLDSKERPIRTKLGSDIAITYSYDTNGRISQTKQGTKNQLDYTYDSSGYLQKITNGRSEETSFGYDLAGRLTSKTFPDNRVVQYQYDSNGNMTGITPPGRSVHTLGYNAMGLNSSYQSPIVTGATTYGYNLDKQMTSITRPNGKTAIFSYDSLKGLLNQIAVAAGNYSYSYSATIPGQVDSLQSPYGVKNSFSYRGSIVSADEQIRSSDSVSMGKVSFGFDTDHRVTARTVKDSASNTYSRNYTLNADGQPTQVGDLGLSYSGTSGRLSTTVISKISDSRTYDSYGNLASYTSVYTPTSGPIVTLYSYTLTRDSMSRITEVSETIGGVTSDYEYQFDIAGRLTLVKKNSVTTASFTYDSNSNRTNQTVDGVSTVSVFDDEDRMTSFGSKTYTYDDNGDLTQSTTISSVNSYYTYDVFGNLTEATPDSGTTYNYIFDGKNRLVGKSISGTLSRRYLYQDQLKVVAQLNASGVLQKEFVYATGSQTPDYMITSAGKYRVLTNHLGSPRLLVDVSTGTIMQRMDYNVLGAVTADTSPDFQPFGYAGCLYDQDTKLCRFGARDYDASIGRWLSKDPILFAGGDTNLYGYVMQDPTNLIDPSGLEATLYIAPPYHAVLGVTNPNSPTGKTYGHFYPSGNSIGLLSPTQGKVGITNSYPGLIPLRTYSTTPAQDLQILQNMQILKNMAQNGSYPYSAAPPFTGAWTGQDSNNCFGFASKACGGACQ